MTRPFKILRRIAVVVLLLFILLVAMQLLGEPVIRGMLLRNSILNAISSAKAIRVIEHSSPYDDIYAPKDKYKEQIFQKVDLSKEQISALQRAFPRSPDFSGTTAHACIFEDHHRIEIFQTDGDIFTIDICFKCEDLRINGNEKRMMPAEWPSSLKTFIKTLGMRPDGPFRDENNAEHS